MLPESLKASLESKLGTAISGSHYVGGGDINQAARVETVSESYFLKWNTSAPEGMFTAEARGLELLAAAHALRIPQVAAVGEAADGVPAYLLLEWLPPARPKNPTLFAERLGEGLAALHQTTTDMHGLDHDNYIGRLPQPNTQEANWPVFYRDHRIGFQQELARKLGRLPREREHLLDSLRQKIPDLVPDGPASLIHGDLWGGNYMAIEGDIPVIYDPAAYYGHREMEMGMTELFGGFPARFYEAYNATYPLDSGYGERRALYQLYHLLSHLNHFGGGHGSQADSVARRYVR